MDLLANTSLDLDHIVGFTCYWNEGYWDKQDSQYNVWQAIRKFFPPDRTSPVKPRNAEGQGDDDRLWRSSGITTAMLFERGVAARAQGANTRTRMLVHPSLKSGIFRRATSCSLSVDATIPRAQDRGSIRGMQLSRWTNNSCAFDATLDLIVFLKVWICRIDQLSESMHAQLKEALARFRSMIIRCDRDGSKDVLRDYWMSVFSGYDGKYAPGKFADNNEVLESTTSGAPSLSWTEARVTRHCDGSWTIDDVVTPVQHQVFYFSMQTAHNQNYPLSSLSDQLTHRWRIHADRKSLCNCRGRSCDGQGRSVNMILDRLPPYLHINVQNAQLERTQESLKAYKAMVAQALYHPVQVTYTDGTGQEKTIEYRACATVVFSSYHFVVFIDVGDGEYMWRDGQLHDQFRVAEGLWQRREKLTTIILRKVS